MTRIVTQQDSIRFGDADIEFEVRRSPRRRKTIEISVDGGGVRVAAPMYVPDREVRAFVRKRAPWIIQRRAEAEERVRNRFADGETLPYLGRPVRMTFEKADVKEPEVYFEGGAFRVAEPPGLEGPERCRAVESALAGWYFYRAMERLPGDADRWWPLLAHGTKPNILVRNQRSRWGSCASDGTIRLNWRLMMLSPDLIDYVVVHELAHLQVRNHSPDFWNVVRGVMPDVQERRRLLKEAGRTLPL